MRNRHLRDHQSQPWGPFFRIGLVVCGGFCPVACLAAGAEPLRILPDTAWLGVIGLLLALGMAAAWWRELRGRRRAEAQLGSANDRLRALFDESPLSICLFDPNDRDIPCRIVECNQYACDLHGRSREELIGRSATVLAPLVVTYENAQEFLARLRKGPCRGEDPHCRKDGSVFFIEYISRLVMIDGREYIIGVDRDLSEERARRVSEEQLRQTAELNHLVLRASNDGVWDWAVTEGRIIFSDRCREMLGYTREELPDDGARWLALLHHEDIAMHEELLRRHWEENEPYVYQFRARHKDGNWRWIISRAITLFDGERRPLRMVGCRTDITEMMRLDAELLQSRKLRAVGEMVGGIAHEFNNLLTPMLLHAEMLEMENSRNPRLAVHVGPIRIGIDRARELTRRILTFGRRSVEACEYLSLEEIVRDNHNFLAQTIDRRIQITIDPPSAPTVVRGNRSDLNQLVVNLILNARDALLEKAGAAPPGDWVPRIWMSLESITRASGARDARDRHLTHHWHRLTVRDNGMGMSDEVRERVFEPFFTTKTVGKGTGLGLATAWHVSSELGGWIDIESRQDEGAAFYVFLPAVTGKQASLPERAASPEANPAPHAATARLRVLLVEDSEMVACATQQMIASFGHEVDLITDGRAAWEKLSGNAGAYDVVFTDLNLPGISGVELVRRLRAAGYTGRVVAYSGHFSSEDEVELVALEVSHLLTKPFEREQLIAILG